MTRSVAILAFVETPGLEITWGQGVTGSAVGAFLTTLVLGAILVAIAPEFTEAKMGAVVDDPVGSFIYGVISLVLIVVVAILLAITIVGLVIAIPLGLVAWLIWAVGSVVAYLAIADRLVDRGDGWLKPLLVAAGLNGALVLTGIGGLISFVIGATGFGTILRSYFE